MPFGIDLRMTRRTEVSEARELAQWRRLRLAKIRNKPSASPSAFDEHESKPGEQV